MLTSKGEHNRIQGQYQPLGDTLFFAPVQPEHLNRIHELESSSYPADEAATFQKLKFRILNAPNVFMVAMQCRDGGEAPEVVGYVCGTCTSAGRLTHESMATHDQEGGLLCIHSANGLIVPSSPPTSLSPPAGYYGAVVVEAALRRKGLATRLLRAYVPYVQATTPHLQAIRLICKQDLIELYEKAGFTLLGPSDVVHGRDPWFEMVLELPSSDS